MCNNKRLHARLLEMYDELDRILKSLGLQYYFIGGCVLGAIRHKGFIPWDDDIDIGMTRRDFEFFESKICDMLPEWLIYMPVEKHLYPEAPIGYLIAPGDGTFPLQECPKIDVFALDGVPDSEKERKRQQFYSLLYHLTVYRQAARNRGGLARFATSAFLALTPSGVLDWLEKKSKKVITAYDTDVSANWCNLFGLKKYRREIMPREYYGTPVAADFEGRKVPVPEMYHEYLTHLYGDYMTPPPENERDTGHTAHVE